MPSSEHTHTERKKTQNRHLQGIHGLKVDSIPTRGTMRHKSHNQQQTERLIDMAHTFKTDHWHVKEARGTAWHPTQFAREHSPYTKARRDLSKHIRARERREMERIARDLEAWGDYYPTGSTLREFATDTDRDGWQF